MFPNQLLWFTIQQTKLNLSQNLLPLFLYFSSKISNTLIWHSLFSTKILFFDSSWFFCFSSFVNGCFLLAFFGISTFSISFWAHWYQESQSFFVFLLTFSLLLSNNFLSCILPFAKSVFRICPVQLITTCTFIVCFFFLPE